MTAEVRLVRGSDHRGLLPVIDTHTAICLWSEGGRGQSRQRGVANDGVAEYGVAEQRADGRRLRRAQNREAVIDALLALFRDGNYQPGMAEIAARAGLSLRSVFRYFDDVDDLHRAAAIRQIALVLPLLEVPVSAAAPTAEKVAAVVAARSALYEQIGPAARALRAGAHRHAPLAAELTRNRAFLRSQLAAVFGPDPAALLPALDVLCSFESWELLRHDQGLSRAAAERALTDAHRALLGVHEEVSAMSEPITTVDFHFDVMCPWAYQASLWMRDVRDQLKLDVGWRFFSLEEINRAEGKKHPWEREWSYGWSMMRVGALLRRTDPALVDRWYYAAGTALHVDGRKPHRPEVAEELVAGLGLDPALVRQAIDDPSTHDDVRADHDRVTGLGGWGVPTLVFPPRIGRR